MVDANPDIIFFLVVDSTDIWEPEPEVDRVPNVGEIDFNTVVMSNDGVITHSYSSECPTGCYGQFDECVYKKQGLP
jgi:hypothetical protein